MKAFYLYVVRGSQRENKIYCADIILIIYQIIEKKVFINHKYVQKKYKTGVYAFYNHQLFRVKNKNLKFIHQIDSKY